MADREDVYCTLVMSDAYLPGAAVLAHSLRDCGTTKKLACLVAADSLRSSTIDALKILYDHVIPVDRVGNPNPKNLHLMNRADLLYTFTKINLWRQTQFRKIVYIDADVVALRAPEELFDLPDPFAAAPDVGWPDAFNTGVMVLSPSMGDFSAMQHLAASGDSFDGADQGLINQYYEHKPWKRLSFSYNCTPSANYQYEPAYRYYKHDISMVHFIGDNKPWRQAGHGQAAPNAYQELLGRWWAVYDRHYKFPTQERRNESAAVRAQVNHGAGNDYYASGYPLESAASDAPSVERQDRGLAEPLPTAEQRRFSAPHMDWDATRAPPPSASKPEAANFPSQVYEFNTNPRPFQPPSRYPQPPSGYGLPHGQDERPKPIFPWEEREQPRPTRRFIEDETQTQRQPNVDDDDHRIYADEFEVNADNSFEPTNSKVRTSTAAPWEKFGTVNKNAWDDVSGIGDYVRSLTAHQKHRGNAQVVQTNQPSVVQQHVLSPMNEPDPDELSQTVHDRRESLILTDFPSAVERPSLPVTPAPRRRTSFWGDERDEDGNLPGAEGVPDQVDWDPAQQLEQLRRNSLLGPEDLKLPANRTIPNRQMISTAASIPEEATGHPVAQAADDAAASGVTEPSNAGQQSTEGNTARTAPTFTEPAFGGSTAATEEAKGEHDALSPTEKPPVVS